MVMAAVILTEVDISTEVYIFTEVANLMEVDILTAAVNLKVAAVILTEVEIFLPAELEISWVSGPKIFSVVGLDIFSGVGIFSVAVNLTEVDILTEAEFSRWQCWRFSQWQIFSRWWRPTMVEQFSRTH